MFFKISTHTPQNQPRVFYYDNIRNLVWDENKSRIRFWMHEAFNNIKKPWYNQHPIIFSKDNPLHKSKKLNALKIQLGLNCNYHCSYCSQAAHRLQDTSNFPTTKTIDEFFEQLDKNQITLKENGRVEIWGGEPLVYWKILSYFIDKLRERYPKAFISMVTNGSLLDKEKVDYFMNRRVKITISHDGPGFKLRDDHNPFDDEKLKGVWLYLLEEGFKHNLPLGFNVVLSPANCDLFAISKYFKEKFDPRAQFGFEGIVNYHSDKQTLMIFDAERRQKLTQSIFTILTEDWSKFPEFGSLISRAQTMINHIVWAVPAKFRDCKCETSSEKVLAVNIHGTVLSCQNCDPVRYGIGDLKNYEQVSNDKFTHWSLRPNCKNCFALVGCRGGCPYLSETEYRLNCSGEKLLWSAIFAGVWYNITGTVVDNISSEPNLTID